MKHIKSFKIFEAEVAEPEVSEWIGTSKVVKNGKPLVVYHGTHARFDKFDKSWEGQTDDGFYGPGFYFTLDREEASEYGPHIIEAYLKIENPFYLRTYSSLGSAVELDLRDDLAKLKGMPKDLKTVRTLPKGYFVKRREDNNGSDDIIVYGVYPSSELYGTDKEEYGPDIKLTKEYDAAHPDEGELQAIVAFNDMVNKIDYESGQANWLLQKVGRNRLDEILKDNGYDGIFVVGADGDKTPINEVSEFVVWEPENIMIKR